MAPPIVWIVVIGYLSIGLFLCGFLHDDPGCDVWLVFLWPALILGVIVCAVISLPYLLGKKLSDIIKKYKNRGNK